MKLVILCLCYGSLLAISASLAVLPNLVEMGYQTDKMLHVFMFTLVSMPATLTGRPWQHVTAYALLLLCAGICAELVQLYLPHRSAQIGDLISNVLGISLGLLIGYLLRSGYHATDENTA